MRIRFCARKIDAVYFFLLPTLVWYGEDKERENGRIYGVFCYGDTDNDEDYDVDFDFPESEITSFSVLLEKIAANGCLI